MVFIRRQILSKMLNFSNLRYLFWSKIFLTVLSLLNIDLILKHRFCLIYWQNQKHYIAYRSLFISPWFSLADLMLHSFPIKRQLQNKWLIIKSDSHFVLGFGCRNAALPC